MRANNIPIIVAAEQQKLGEKTLKHQTEDDAEIHVEEEKAAEFKNQVRTGKKSHEVRNGSLKQTQSRRTWR